MAPDRIDRLNAALEGRYHLLDELGEGGMAVVYLADDLRHDRRVALKLLKPELAAIVGSDRFLAEIKTTARLQHPHILPLFDSGEADGFLYFVLPYVDGESLRERIDREKQLGVDDAVDLVGKVAHALHHAHRQGVVHRDVKPANLLIGAAGEPLVADFGIALAVAQAGAGRLTETGLSLGTPHYVSPEQAGGDHNLGPETDVYALGCVLYEILTGEPPFPGTTTQAVLARILTAQAPSARSLRSGVPRHVDAVIRRALEKVPADRFRSTAEFARALDDRTLRHGDAEDPPATRHGARRLGAVAATVAVLSGALGFFAARTIGSDTPAAPVTRLWLSFEVGHAPLDRLLFTRDASALIYIGAGAESEAPSQLWNRPFDDLGAEPIEGTEGARSFALSPDGTEIAMIEERSRSLVIVPREGGTPRTVRANGFRVWEWAPDGLVYVEDAVEDEIYRVRPDGSGYEMFTRLERDECWHGELSALPSGTHALFAVVRCPSEALADDVVMDVWSLDLKSGERHYLLDGGIPRFSPTGHLLYVGAPEGGPLFAVPVDVRRATVTGSPVVIADGLPRPTVDLGAVYAVARDGTVVYAPHDPGRRTGVARSHGRGDPGGIGMALSATTGRVRVEPVPRGRADRADTHCRHCRTVAGDLGQAPRGRPAGAPDLPGWVAAPPGLES